MFRGRDRGRLPFYVFHQTAIVAVACRDCACDQPPRVMSALATVATFAVSLGAREIAVRRWGPVRLLFGVKPRGARRTDAVPPGAR